MRVHTQWDYYYSIRGLCAVEILWHHSVCVAIFKPCKYLQTLVTLWLVYKVNIWILIENIQIDMRCLRTKLYTEVFSSENLCVNSIEIRHSGQWTYSYPIRNFLSNFGPKAKNASKELILNYTCSKSFCNHNWKTIKSVLEQSQETENNKTIHIEITITALT